MYKRVNWCLLSVCIPLQVRSEVKKFTHSSHFRHWPNPIVLNFDITWRSFQIWSMEIKDPFCGELEKYIVNISKYKIIGPMTRKKMSYDIFIFHSPCYIWSSVISWQNSSIRKRTYEVLKKVWSKKDICWSKNLKKISKCMVL